MVSNVKIDSIELHKRMTMCEAYDDYSNGSKQGKLRKYLLNIVKTKIKLSALPNFHHALNLIIHSKLKIYNIIYITDMFINILTFSIMFSTAFLHKI